MAYTAQMRDKDKNAMYPITLTEAIKDWTPLNISNPSTMGIAYLNGSYDDWANATHYRTIELPDARLVALSVHVSSSQVIDASNKHQLAVLSVPSNIRPMYGIATEYTLYGDQGIWASGEISLSNDGIVTVHIPTNITTDHRAGYHAEFLYLSLKK